MKNFLFLFLLCSACGDVASTRSTTTNSQDNTVDNSQHGISSCSTGSTLVCREQGEGGGADTFTQAIECVNVNGQPIILAELEPVDDDINEACPAPDAIIIPVE